jgi:hypothetical protein
MKLKNTNHWSKIVSPLLDAYNNSPHSTTKISPNKVNKENEIQVLMNINKSAKKGTYHILEIGDSVRVPVTQRKTRTEVYMLLMVHYILERIYN